MPESAFGYSLFSLPPDVFFETEVCPSRSDGLVIHGESLILLDAM
jgi:hypothetical protein